MNKPMIPKEPMVPALTDRQMEELTTIAFLPESDLTPCDAIFVFAGTHPGHWERAIDAYRRGYSKRIIVTGGVSPTGVKHSAWEDANVPEADVIVGRLLQQGVRSQDIVFENRSRNTMENVLFAKEVFDFSAIESLFLVCKNHAAGRQYRTFAKHVSDSVRCVPFGFDAEYRGNVISRNEWMNSEVGRSRVFGEYLRIVHYGRLGHVLPLSHEIEGLEENVELNLGACRSQ